MERDKYFERDRMISFIILFFAPISYEIIRNIVFYVCYSLLHAAYTVSACISCIVCSVFLYFVFFKYVNENMIKRKVRSKRLACKKKMLFWVVIAGIAGCILMNGVVIISQIMQNAMKSYELVSDLIYSGEFVLVFLEIVILAPITEELLFRGIVYQCMIPYVGKFVSAIVSILLFSVLHGNIMQGLYAGIMTVVLVYLYEKFKSLIPCIVFHMSANLISFLGTKTTLLNVFFCSKDVIIMNIVFCSLLFIICVIKISSNRCCYLIKNEKMRKKEKKRVSVRK